MKLFNLNCRKEEEAYKRMLEKEAMVMTAREEAPKVRYFENPSSKNNNDHNDNQFDKFGRMKQCTQKYALIDTNF